MKKHNYPLHIFLFLVTVFTTMMAGAEHRLAGLFFDPTTLGPGSLDFSQLGHGWVFSASFLTFLTFHEFGHYFTAVRHGVKTSLPYYIPVFIPLLMLNIGSFGAVIRIKEMPGSRRKYFDIGVAGPLAGFVISVLLLVIGFTTLPPWETYIGELHPDYLAFDQIPSKEVVSEMRNGFPMMLTGSNFLYDFMASIFANPQDLPPPHEMIHYPLLFAGFLTLFFTALNLLPIGQLDGGHVIYGLFGKRVHGWVSRAAVMALLFFGGTGLMYIPSYAPAQAGPYWNYLLDNALVFLLYAGLVYLVMRRMNPNWSLWMRLGMVVLVMGAQYGAKAIFPSIEVNPIWLLYVFLSVTVLGLDHPATADEQPLNLGRKILGWLAILIFLLSFSLEPISMF